MQTLILTSFIVNIILMVALLSYVVLPKVSKLYRSRKKLRETQAIKGREEEIRRIVEEVLKDIIKD